MILNNIGKKYLKKLSSSELQKSTYLNSFEQQNIFESNPISMWIYDLDTLKFLAVNDSAIQTYGYSRDEFLSMTLEDIRPDDDALALHADILMNKEERQKSTYWRHKKKDGSIIYVDIHSQSLLGIDKIRARLVMSIDVSDRKLIDDKLRDSELKFRTLCDSTNAGIFLYKIPDYIYVNKGAERLTGYTAEELVGMNFWHIIHPEDRDFARERGFARLSGKKTVDKYELRFVTKSGEVKYIDFTAGIISLNGETISIGTAYDITERKISVLELLKAKEKAEQADKLKTIFLANMSHELRTPLVGILGYTELLAEETTNPDHLEMTHSILNSGRRLMDTLNSIIDISRIEANKYEIKPSAVDLSNIIRETVFLFKQQAEDKSLFLNVIQPEKPVLFNSDSELLSKIFINLISNAVKYTPSGGITIKTTILNEGSNKFAIVDVIDSGIGINSKNHHLIFQPFRQVSEGLTRNFEGNGLGLSITKRFVELLYGTITFKSSPGKGSTFSVRFPLPDEDLVIEEENKVTTDATGNFPANIKILLVEDDLSNASIICAYLKDHFSIDHVLDGKTAIDYCKARKYDSILMDINLKGITGIEALHHIRKLDDYYVKLPVIAVTAYAMMGDKEKLLSLGFDYYVSKPFKREELFNLLVNILKD